MWLFQIVTTEGERLGLIELSRSEWPPGSYIARGSSEGRLRVVETIAATEALGHPVLVVERS